MSVEIKLAFDTAEEAIVALGKLVGIKGRKNPVVTEPQPIVPPTLAPLASNIIVEPKPEAAPAPKPTRRPGRPRGSRNVMSEQGAAVVPPVSQAPAQPAALPPAAPSTASPSPATPQTAAPGISTATSAVAPSAPPAPAAAVPTEEDVQKAVEKIFTAKDYDGTLALLQRFGVKRGKDLPADQRANFINRVAGVLERGEAI